MPAGDEGGHVEGGANIRPATPDRSRAAHQAAVAGERRQADEGGSVRLVTDANGNETAFAYDFYGNMQTSTNGEGEVTKMVRDDAGNMTGVTEGLDTPAERTTAYLFDDLGRTIEVTDGQGGVTETVYDADGNTIAEIDETGIAAETEYDEMGREFWGHST